jgi:presenilin-like A22 family membrane protease
MMEAMNDLQAIDAVPMPGVVGVRYLWVEQAPIMHALGTSTDIRLIAAVLAYWLARHRGQPWAGIPRIAIGAIASITIAFLAIEIAAFPFSRFIKR